MKQEKLVLDWIEINKDEIKVVWIVYDDNGEIIKIKGLKYFFMRC